MEIENIKAYAKQNDVSISEIKSVLFPHLKSQRQRHSLFNDYCKENAELVYETIKELHELKVENEKAFSKCGFMTHEYGENHTDCKALCKAFCLVEGKCNFFKTDAEILDGILKYGDGSNYAELHGKAKEDADTND